MKAEDWKSFKAGGYHLFKRGHVQNIVVDQKDSQLGIWCNWGLPMGFARNEERSYIKNILRFVIELSDTAISVSQLILCQIFTI